MSDLLYTVFTNIAPKHEEEFNAWQETEHGPYLITLPGYQSVIRYKDCDTPHRYANFWHISSMKDFENPERLVRAKTPWGNYLSPYRDRRIDFYVQDQGLEAAPPSAELADAFLLLVADSYSDEEDRASSITSHVRARLAQLRAIQNVMDVRIYHGYQGKGIAENYVFYYLSCSLQTAETDTLPRIDALLGEAGKKMNRTRMTCYSQNSKVKAIQTK